MVEKAIRDNFPGWSETETHVNRLNNETLFDVIKKAKKSNKQGARILMGKLFYNNLRKKFQRQDSPWNRIDELLANLDDKESIIDDVLETALIGLCERKKVCDRFHDWCEYVVEINKLCMGAACKQLLKMPPQRSLDNAMCVISLMKVFARLGLVDTMPELFAIMREHFDAAAVKSFQSFKAAGHGSPMWWEANEDWAGLLLPAASVQKCLDEEKSWEHVSAELCEIVGGSNIGALLFGKARDQIEVDEVMQIANTTVEKLGVAITVAKVAVARREFLVKMREAHLDPNKEFDKPKKVDLKYRDAPTSVNVSTPLEFFALRLEAYKRGLAVENGSLPKLWCEDEFVDRAQVVGQVDAAVVSNSKKTRKSALEQLADDDVSGCNIMAVLKANGDFHLKMDRNWRIEQAFWQGCIGDTALTRLQTTILAALPTDEKPITLEASLARFESLEKSKLLQFCGPAPKTTFNAVKGYVKNISSNVASGLEKANDSQFMVTVKLRCGHWCVRLGAD